MEVHTGCEHLDPSETAGPENIPSNVLTFCDLVLASNLDTLFNLLLPPGVLP